MTAATPAAPAPAASAPSAPAPAAPAPSAPARPRRAFGAMLAAELRLLARDPAALFWSMLLPAAAMAVLALVPATREPSPGFGGIAPAMAYQPVLALFALSMLAIQLMPTTLATYRETGVLRRLRTTPASPWTLLGVFAVLGLGLSLAIAAAIVLIGWACGLGLPEHLGHFALAALGASVAFLGIGAVVAALVPSPRAVAGAAVPLTALTWFAAGMWVPRALMADWLRAACDATPGGAGARAMLAAQQGAAPDWAALAILAAWGAVGLAVAVRAFRFD